MCLGLLQGRGPQTWSKTVAFAQLDLTDPTLLAAGYSHVVSLIASQFIFSFSSLKSVNGEFIKTQGLLWPMLALSAVFSRGNLELRILLPLPSPDS